MKSRDIIQLITVGLAVYCFVGLLVWALKVDMRRRWAFPVLVWILHTIVFYIADLILLISGIPRFVNFTDWSSFLRLHGYATVAWIVLTLNILNGKLDGYNDSRRVP